MLQAITDARTIAQPGARWLFVESPSPSIFLFEHNLFGKPVPTFPDHALVRRLSFPHLRENLQAHFLRRTQMFARLEFRLDGILRLEGLEDPSMLRHRGGPPLRR